ncbi:MAG: hypothetical protein IJV37_00330 [Bacteroidales bacterium]|nr:hypothetical protein [Bacteroidales bacterium]
MKKLIAVLAGALAFAAVASAQPRAIGIRAGYGGELSYQHALGTNFIEADLGFFVGNGLHLNATYDFVFAAANIFDFYIGPGFQIGAYNAKTDTGSAMRFNIGLVAQLGVEAQIPSVPINISLDWRPTIVSIGGPYWAGVALGIRYRF